MKKQYIVVPIVAPFEREPDITVIKPGGWLCRPVLWLMCPYYDRPGMAFQVGEFRDWRSAELARGRLVEELRKLRGKAPNN